MKQFIGLAACALLLTSGCSTLDVSHDWDPQAQFSQYRTWTWMAGSPAPTGDPRIDDNTLLHDRIKRAVESALGEKGLRNVVEGEADLLVAYYAGLEQVIQVTQLNDYYHYPAGWGRRYHPYAYGYAGTARTEVSEFQRGSLILDLADARSKNLVWRSVARDDVDFRASAEAREAKLREAVREMFSKFPPPEKK